MNGQAESNARVTFGEMNEDDNELIPFWVKAAIVFFIVWTASILLLLLMEAKG